MDLIPWLFTWLVDDLSEIAKAQAPNLSLFKKTRVCRIIMVSTNHYTEQKSCPYAYHVLLLNYLSIVVCTG